METKKDYDLAEELIKDREAANRLERASRKAETNKFWIHYNASLIPKGQRAYHVDGNWSNARRDNLALCADGPLDEDVGPAERLSPRIRA